MSRNARVFGEGYRGRPLEVEEACGVELLVPGQVEAIWADEEHERVEVSYVHQLGHCFVVVMLDAGTLEPLKLIEAGIYGVLEKRVPPRFRLSDEMRRAVVELKARDAAPA